MGICNVGELWPKSVAILLKRVVRRGGLSQTFKGGTALLHYPARVPGPSGDLVPLRLNNKFSDNP
jgi:hypothetical protein